uniref:Uncharacterized protein n=1 Tax=Junco hyemalis TaxID=40217 RepID=A0A8C5NS68_JUNHY
MEPPRSLPGLERERPALDAAGGCPSPLDARAVPGRKVWVKLRALFYDSRALRPSF